MPALRAILLDIDGTLVDSDDAHAHAWVKALSKHDIAIPFPEVRRLIGKGGDKLLPELTGIAADSPAGEAISHSRADIFQREFLPSLQPFPRVKELLTRLQHDGFRLGVASSAKDDELASLLRVCGADEFIEAKTSSDDADNSKPDPDVIHAALKKLGLPPAQVLLLGDTSYDVQAGQKADVQVVAVRCGGWTDANLTGAIAIYDDVADLVRHYAESPLNHGISEERTTTELPSCRS